MVAVVVRWLSPVIYGQTRRKTGLLDKTGLINRYGVVAMVVGGSGGCQVAVTCYL